MTPYSNFVITPYALLTMLAALSIAFVAAITWTKRNRFGARPLIALSITAFFWSAGAGIGRMTVSIEAKTDWAIVEYIGVLLVPVFYLLFALEYKTQTNWFTPRPITALSIVPGVLWVMSITNNLHRLIWRDIVPVGPPEANLANFIHGPAFYIGVIGYGYTLLAISTVILIRAALRPSPTHRRQASLIIIGAATPWVTNILYVLNIKPPGIDLTPISIVFSGILFAIAILRYQLLELVPLAHDTLIQTMDDGIIVLDVQNRLIELNPAACRLMGVSNTHLGKPFEQVLATMPGWHGNTHPLIPGRVEVRVHYPASRTLEMHISAIQDRSGVLSGHLLALRDITEQKAANAALEQLNNHLEELVEQRTQALAASQARFDEVITSISDHVFALRVNPDGTVTSLYSTPHFLEMTGRPAPMPGDTIQTSTAATVHPDDLDGLLAVYAQTLETGHGEHEHRWVRTDGSILWVRSSLRLIVKDDEAIIYGVNSDITERKRTEDATAEIGAFIEQDRLRLELVSSVSHELRTPLGIIKGATTTLQRPDVTFSPTLRRQMLTNIITEADRLDRLVADLLDISQMEQRLITLNVCPVDLATLVQAQVRLVQHKFDIAPITTGMPITHGIPITHGMETTAHNFILHKPDTPIIADIDAPRMEQVLRNLLDNAIIYSPNGGDITITLRTAGAFAEIEITDTGIGIATAEQPHIFERFFRSDHPAVQSVRGTGLGLAISSEIIQAHRGTIEVSSTPDSGSTFTVRIPLHFQAPAAGAANSPAEDHANSPETTDRFQPAALDSQHIHPQETDPA